jgi:hypothetical protein
MKSTSQSASTRQLLYLNCSVCKHWVKRERGVIVFQNKKHIFNCGRGTDGETDISLASGLNKIISIGPYHDPWAVCILFSGVTSLPLTTTSRPSLGGENQM